MDGLSGENQEENQAKEIPPFQLDTKENNGSTMTDSTDEIDVAPSDDDENDDDIDKMLNELQGFQEELEQESQNVADELDAPSPFIRAPSLPSKPLDEFRFSMTAMEDTGEVDLDALLEDLCIMEKDLNSNNSTVVTTDQPLIENSFAPKPNSPLSPTVKVPADVRSRLESVQEENKELTWEEQQERIKAEKIRIALEKLRAARVKKLVVKVYNDEDPTSKTIAIDQTWTAWEVSKKMMIKNDAEPDPNWTLVERLPELCIERCLEDHESVVDIVSYWPWENENRIVITNKRDKYALFRNPQNYLLSSGTSAGAAQLAEKSKDILIQEHFQPDAMRLPELEGVLYLKEGKKSWKKHFFVLRASGIYYTPKGKTKSSKDLICLVKFEFVSVYTGGAAFKKKFKAPTEHCFVLKHPEYHEIDSKAIKYFCAEDQKTLQRWTVCIRVAKYGYKMLDDYATTQDEMDRIAFSLDKNRFPKASSFSAGQKSEPTYAQISDARDKALKAKAQSDRLKLAIGNNPGGSQSFSVSRKITPEPKQPKKKSIGNLFSDAWKKGDDVDDDELPSSPSSAGPGMTPNTTEPKAFNIDNAMIMDEIVEEEHPPSPRHEIPPPPPPQRPQQLDIAPPPPPNQLDVGPPPPPPNQLNIGPPLATTNQEGEDEEETARIPSPTDIKTMLEGLQSPPPQLSQKEMGSTDSLDNIPLPPPPEMMLAGSDVDLPPPPPEVLLKNRSNSENRDRSNSGNKPPPPPPPPKKGRSRTSSSDKSS